jgi:hypothetical protein
LAQVNFILLIINGFNFASGIFNPSRNLLFQSQVSHKSSHGSGWILMFIRTWQGMFLSAKIGFVCQKHLAPEGEELFRSHNSVATFKNDFQWMKQEKGRRAGFRKKTLPYSGTVFG